MLVLNNSYELGTTYLRFFFLWMFCSELVVSFACVYFVVTGDFMPLSGLSIFRANLASTEKVRMEKSGSLYLGTNLQQHSVYPKILALILRTIAITEMIRYLQFLILAIEKASDH